MIKQAKIKNQMLLLSKK